MQSWTNGRTAVCVLYINMSLAWQRQITVYHAVNTHQMQRDHSVLATQCKMYIHCNGFSSRIQYTHTASIDKLLVYTSKEVYKTQWKELVLGAADSRCRLRWDWRLTVGPCCSLSQCGRSRSASGRYWRAASGHLRSSSHRRCPGSQCARARAQLAPASRCPLRLVRSGWTCPTPGHRRTRRCPRRPRSATC